jgi:predicted RNA polymerase sigma factor
MLLTDARRSAREAPDRSLVPLAEQDRGRWNRALIDEGIALVTRTLARSRVGPYQVQAAIAAVHAEADVADETDWRQIDALYALLEHLNPSPVVVINHAVAIGMVRGPRAGLTALEPLDGDERLRRNHRLHAVRAHLLELAGELEAAGACYRTAARLTSSIPEQRYLQDRADRLAASGRVENWRAAPTSA